MDSRAGGKPVDELEALEQLRGELRRLLDETAGLGDPPYSVDPNSGVDFWATVAEYERALIGAALRQTKGQQNKAAELLHLNPTTLHTKIRKLGINPDEF